MSDDPLSSISEPQTEADYARLRRPDRTYIARSSPYPFSASSDFGEPSRRVRRVFDEVENSMVPDGEESQVISANSRTQICLWVVRELGRVKEIRIERVPQPGVDADVKTLLSLTGENCERLINLVRIVDRVPPDGVEGIRIDDSLLDLVLADPNAAGDLYRYDPGFFRTLMAADVEAEDVIAIGRRRSQVERFRQLLTDDSFFDAQVDAASTRGAEAIWQTFFEENPWILGVSLSSQILTSWSSSKLEQVVAGNTAIQKGKRVDALLETRGAVSTFVFAEFKTHRTDLLGKEYRGGCWAPSEALTCGIAQVHGTVHRAMYDLSDHVIKTAPDGSVVPGRYSYLLRPRSYLIVGQLSELHGELGGDHMDKVRSFELFRRQVQEPEIVTFDELLARAEWHVNLAERES